MTDRNRERTPWRNIRDSGVGFFISICVFGTTAFIASALLKSRYFDGFFDHDSYWRADSFCGTHRCNRVALHNLFPSPIVGKASGSTRVSQSANSEVGRKITPRAVARHAGADGCMTKTITFKAARDRKKAATGKCGGRRSRM